MNQEQKNAAEHLGSPLLVLAGPGTGKTTTLVGRYEFLLNEAFNSEEILCCTFSKKAADELKKRISENTGVKASSLPIGTFHSLSIKILKSIGFEINIKNDFQVWANDYERVKVIKQIQSKEENTKLYAKVAEEESSAKAALQFIDAAREQLLDPEDASIRASEKNNLAEIAHSEVYQSYEKYLDKEAKIDFPRMVQLACKAIIKNSNSQTPYASKYAHVLIDEFQDINLAQKKLIDLILATGSELWAVGDDYQAIYGFRGSDVRYMLDFHKLYPGSKVLALSKNYRSGSHILNAASNLSKHFLEAFRKNLTPVRKTEGQVFIDEVKDEDEETDALIDEITLRIEDGIALSEIAVLSRTKNRPKKIAARLIQRGIPISIHGGVLPFEELEAKQLVSAVAIYSNIFLNKNLRWPRISKDLFGFAKRLEQDQKPWESAVKALATHLIKRPPQDIGAEDIEHRTSIIEEYRDRLLESTNANEFFPIFEASLAGDGTSEKVFVGTIHSSKGLEWDSVFLIGLEDGHLPQRQSTSPQEYDEERKIAYVGITRAKNFLLITHTQYQGEDENQISPFISEIIGPQKRSKSQATKNKNQKSTQTSPVVEKIQNLLKKSKDIAASPAEAEAAEKMAHKLMLKYKISIKGVHPVSIQKDQTREAVRQRDQFHQNDVSQKDSEKFVAETRKNYWERVIEKSIRDHKNTLDAEERARTAINETNLADGLGDGGSGWESISASPGLLQEVGYTTKKDGPSTAVRHDLLRDVLNGKTLLPDWLSDTVQIQWGAPNSAERFNKIRNTLNVALGTQKGRRNPSLQAIKKWEEDINFMDNNLKQDLLTT